MIFQEIKNGNWGAIALLPKAIQALILLVLTVIVAAGGAFAYDYFGDKTIEFERLVNKEVDLRKQLENLQRVRNTIAQYDAVKVEAEAKLMEVRKRLPTQILMNDFNKDLDAIAKKNGVIVNRYVKQADGKVDKFITSASVSLSGCSTYHNFANFIADLSGLARIITLEKASFSNNRAGISPNKFDSTECGNFGANSFPFTAVLSTYKYAGQG